MSASIYLNNSCDIYIESRHISILFSLFLDKKNIVSCS